MIYIRKIFASNNITRVANGLTVCNINSDEKEFTEHFGENWMMHYIRFNH